MLISELYGKTRSNLNDLGITFYSDARIQNAVHNAYYQTIILAGSKEKEIQLTFQADKCYYDFAATTTDFYAVVAVYHMERKDWLIPKTLRELDDINDKWEIWNGTPRYFCPVSWKWTAIVPNPSTASGTFKLFYKALGRFDEGFNTVVDIPQAYLSCLSDRATAELLETFEEYKKAQNWWAAYFEKAYKARVATTGRNNPDLFQGFSQVAMRS